MKKLKEPIDEFKLMVGAAVSACERRRIIVKSYYELAAEIENIKLIIINGSGHGGDSHNIQLDNKLCDLKKKAEEMEEQVKNSAKILDEEMQLFKKSKERDL